MPDSPKEQDSDYEVWSPEPEYTVGEILERLPWVDDAGETAIVKLPVRPCYWGGNHGPHAHFLTRDSQHTVVEFYWCLGRGSGKDPICERPNCPTCRKLHIGN
jgi:hypothetical protein